MGLTRKLVVQLVCSGCGMFRAEDAWIGPEGSERAPRLYLDSEAGAEEQAAERGWVARVQGRWYCSACGRRAGAPGSTHVGDLPGVRFVVVVVASCDRCGLVVAEAPGDPGSAFERECELGHQLWSLGALGDGGEVTCHRCAGGPAHDIPTGAHELLDQGDDFDDELTCPMCDWQGTSIEHLGEHRSERRH